MAGDSLMKIEPVTSNDQWLSYMIRGAKANKKDTNEAVVAFINLLLQTWSFHYWVYALPSRGRKGKGNRLYKLATQYLDSLPNEDKKELLDHYFEVQWEKVINL